jgi:hypothetical protein
MCRAHIVTAHTKKMKQRKKIMKIANTILKLTEQDNLEQMLDDVADRIEDYAGGEAEFKIQKDGSIYFEWKNHREKMRSEVWISKDYKKIEHTYNDQDGLEYTDKHKTKNLKDAIEIMYSEITQN